MNEVSYSHYSTPIAMLYKKKNNFDEDSRQRENSGT